METYSFLDCILNLAFPGGVMTITGKGIGSASIQMAQERSAMEAAADGNIMISKIAGNHGSLVIEVQQTSAAHKFLLQQYNFLILAPPAIWAQGAGLMRCLSDSSSHTFTGLCFQKLGDKGYEKQGKMVSWNLLCGDIQSIPF
jgi:hypothetical protein